MPEDEMDVGYYLLIDGQRVPVNFSLTAEQEAESEAHILLMRANVDNEIQALGHYLANLIVSQTNVPNS